MLGQAHNVCVLMLCSFCSLFPFRKVVLLWWVTAIPACALLWLLSFTVLLAAAFLGHSPCLCDGHISGCVGARGAFSHIVVGIQISGSEHLSNPQTHYMLAQVNIFSFLHDSIEILLTDSMHFIWASIMYPVRCLLCLFPMNIMGK